MQIGKRSLLGAGLFIALPLSVLLMAGCSKSDSAGEGTPPPAGQAEPGRGPEGMSRGGGPPRGGGGGGPVAADASGADIYKAKCGCHGPDGKGGRAPVLTGVSGDSDEKLTTTIHDGKGKMPAFGSQLSDAQIKKVVATIKSFK